MRQAVHFSGKTFINVSGIPEGFWQNQNWTVTALLKFGEINVESDIAVLGIGDSDRSHGLHLGIRATRNRNRNYVSMFCFCFCV